MQSWDLLELETPGGSRSPIVLHSTDEARAVLIRLDAGQELGDHQVKERAYVVVVDGEVVIKSGADGVRAGRGTMVRFDADERRRVSSETGARILLLLTPWPGPGHYRGNPDRAAPGASAPPPPASGTSGTSSRPSGS